VEHAVSWRKRDRFAHLGCGLVVLVLGLITAYVDFTVFTGGVQ